MYICRNCGTVFTEPDYYREYRGECFGFPAYEEISCCPACWGDDYDPLTEEEMQEVSIW